VPNLKPQEHLGRIGLWHSIICPTSRYTIFLRRPSVRLMTLANCYLFLGVPSGKYNQYKHYTILAFNGLKVNSIAQIIHDSQPIKQKKKGKIITDSLNVTLVVTSPAH
jgi:hypothetical protein